MDPFIHKIYQQLIYFMMDLDIDIHVYENKVYFILIIGQNGKTHYYIDLNSLMLASF